MILAHGAELYSAYQVRTLRMRLVQISDTMTLVGSI